VLKVIKPLKAADINPRLSTISIITLRSASLSIALCTLRHLNPKIPPVINMHLSADFTQGTELLRLQSGHKFSSIILRYLPRNPSHYHQHIAPRLSSKSSTTPTSQNSINTPDPLYYEEAIRASSAHTNAPLGMLMSFLNRGLAPLEKNPAEGFEKNCGERG